MFVPPRDLVPFFDPANGTRSCGHTETALSACALAKTLPNQNARIVAAVHPREIGSRSCKRTPESSTITRSINALSGSIDRQFVRPTANSITPHEIRATRRGKRMSRRVSITAGSMEALRRSPTVGYGRIVKRKRGGSCKPERCGRAEKGEELRQ